MKGIFLDDDISNLTSASTEASLSSSSNRNEIGTMYPPPQMQQTYASVPITTTNQTQSNKKKRNLPGNPGIIIRYVYIYLLQTFINFLLFKNFFIISNMKHAVFFVSRT